MADKNWNLVIKQQQDWGTIALNESKGLEISKNLDYDNASEIVKDLKTRIKQIQDYWKPLKETAYKQWKNIGGKEKELLRPFVDAEMDVKVKMAEWQRKKLEEERLLKEEAERAIKEEEERLNKIAQKEKEKGNIEHAEYLQQMAYQESVKEIKLPKAHKTEGTSRRITWKARIINEDKVPNKVLGMIVRPVDIKALNKIAQMSNGQASIDGVVFYEDVTIAIRT